MRAVHQSYRTPQGLSRERFARQARVPLQKLFGSSKLATDSHLLFPFLKCVDAVNMSKDPFNFIRLFSFLNLVLNFFLKFLLTIKKVQKGKAQAFRVSQSWFQTSVFTTHCMMLDKCIIPSEPQFPHL